MANTGIKIAKKNKSIDSTDPNDYRFWTKYKTLMLLGQRDDTVTFTHGSMQGTKIVAHKYDFIPFVMMYVTDQERITLFSTPLFVPYRGERDIYVDYQRWQDSGGEQVSEGVGAKIDDTNITFNWWSYSWNPQMGDSYPATTYDDTLYITTYFYNLELGRILPD